MIAPVEMQNFTLVGLNPVGRAPSADFVVAADASAASHHAVSFLMDHQSCDCVEVWRDGDLLMVMKRDALSS